MEPKDYEELQRLQHRYENGEAVDEDRLYELELLNRHQMGDNLTTDEQDDLVVICKERGYEHDQLPNVEEYKAQMGYKEPKKGLPKLLQSLRPTKQDPTEHKLDPDGHYFHYVEEEGDDEEVIDFVQPENDGVFADPDAMGMMTFTVEDDYLQEQAQNSDQLPKITISHSWPYGKAIALVILPTIIAVSVILALFPKQSNKDYHWLHGETDNYLAIKDFVTVQRGISHVDAFETVDSPQYLAAQWMAHGDAMQLDVPDSPDPTFEDRYVMAVFYFSLGGPNWENQVGFLGNGHICSWFQEYSINRGSKQEQVQYGLHGCEANPHHYFPRTLSLPSNGLVGTIPHEVHALDRLTTFNLEYNGGVTGTLPPALWKMSSLEQLILQWCSLKGTIPTWVGQLDNLTYLGLGNNQFEGLVPTEISKLTNLMLLGLDNNSLDGTFDTFAPLVMLKSLYLDHNYLSGTLTDELIAGWPKLQELDLSDTLLMGSLPSTLFSASNDLRVVDLHANQLQGPLPTINEQNTKLEFLALHENSLSGFIPESLTNLKTIQHLDLSINSLISSIPEKFGELTNLRYLHIGLNNFVGGTVPKFLIELTNLRELSLKDSRLTGTIPEYIQYLSNLQFLDLHDNRLTGTIPKGISKLTMMRHMILKQNQLRGTLPQGFSAMTDLELLLLEQNDFEGDAKVICESNRLLVDTFVADCYTGYGSASNASSSFTCSCCSTCCSKDDPNCNDWEWKGNLDPSWEYGFRRERYSYNLGPVVWTP